MRNELIKTINNAINNGTTQNVIEKLIELYEKEDEKEKSFTQALAEFQKLMPAIPKTKKVLNRDGTIRYQYASIDEIVEAVKFRLAECGFAYYIETEQTTEHVKAKCIIRHKDGGKIESSFTIPVFSGEYMSEPQKVASALTYAKRYAFCNALGIMTADEDDDNNIAVNNKDVVNIKLLEIIKKIKEAETPADIEAIKQEARAEKWTKKEIEILKSKFEEKEAEINA